MSNGIGRVWAVNAEGGDEGRPNGVGPVYIENADQLGSKLPEPAAGDAGKVLGVLNENGDVGWVVGQSGTLTQVQADWDESDSSQVSYIQNKPSLATVATSGSYTDLSNKPTIPTVDQAYDAASANAQSGVAVAGAISGKQDTISDLSTIRSGAEAGATAVQPSQLATVATSGSYADLSNKPTIPAAQVNSDWDAVSGVSQILNKPTLATVATSGDYDDLLNKPTIPAAQVQSDWNQTNDQAVDFIKNKPTIPTGVVVDQSYNASSTNAQSGTAVAGALATVNQVPASTSADEDKVLTVNSSGTPVWAAAQGGGADVTVDTTNNNIEFGSDVVLHYTVTDGGSVTWTGSRNEFSGTLFEWRWDNSEPAPSATLTLTIPNNISRTGNAITSVVFKDVSNSICTVSGGTLLSNGVIQAGTYTVTASSAATTVTIKATVTFTNSLSPVDGTYISAGFDATTLGISGGTPTADLMPNVARTSADNGKVLGITDTSGTLGWVAQTPAQVNADWDAVSGVSQIINKPSLATVATSGSYNDLSNKPSIPAAQVNSDWNAASGVAQILNKPSLATVATSGSYDDLTNKPSIPAAQVNSDWDAVSGVSQILNKPALATVATSGSYADLSNKPTIPTVDQSYNASSTNAQSGVAVANAISAVKQVPASTSADEGKVLTVNSSGNAVWDAAPETVTIGYKEV